MPDPVVPWSDPERDPPRPPGAASLLRNRAFLAVWSASTISVFGSLITRTALPLAAIMFLDAGALEVSAIRSAEMVAALLIGLVAGAWVDRLRRRPILVWTNVGRAAVLATIPVAFLLDGLGLVQLLIVAFAAAMLSTFSDVADNAYLPTIVPRERLVAANSALTATGSVAEFSGFGLGGILIEVFKAPIAIAIDVATFVVSALILLTIRAKEPPPKPVIDREPVLREIRDGLRIVAHSPILRALALSHGGTHILWGIFGTSYLLFAIDELHLGPAAIGIIAGLGGIGSFVGSAMVPFLVPRLGVGRTILIGIFGFTLGNALIPLAPAEGVVMGISLGALFLVAQQLFGDAFATAYEVTEMSLVQASVENRVLGRVNASIGTFTTLLTLLGAVMGGVIAETWGLRAAFAVGLIGAVLAFLAVWFSPVRHVRDAPIAPHGLQPGDEAPLTE